VLAGIVAILLLSCYGELTDSRFTVLLLIKDHSLIYRIDDLYTE